MVRAVHGTWIDFCEPLICGSFATCYTKRTGYCAVKNIHNHSCNTIPNNAVRTILKTDAFLEVLIHNKLRGCMRSIHRRCSASPQRDHPVTYRLYDIYQQKLQHACQDLCCLKWIAFELRPSINDPRILFSRGCAKPLGALCYTSNRNAMLILRVLVVNMRMFFFAYLYLCACRLTRRRSYIVFAQRRL